MHGSNSESEASSSGVYTSVEGEYWGYTEALKVSTGVYTSVEGEYWGSLKSDINKPEANH